VKAAKVNQGFWALAATTGVLLLSVGATQFLASAYHLINTAQTESWTEPAMLGLEYMAAAVLFYAAIRGFGWLTASLLD